MARKYESTGVVQAAPGNINSLDSQESTIGLGYSATLAAESSGACVSINAADITPQTIASDIPLIQVLVIRVLSGGPLKCYVTSNLGSQQVLPLSSSLSLNNTNNSADSITSVKLSGVGTVEYIAAG